MPQQIGDLGVPAGVEVSEPVFGLVLDANPSRSFFTMNQAVFFPGPGNYLSDLPNP